MSEESKTERYLAILQRLGIRTSQGTVTQSSRGFWGGVMDDGTIVVTAWDDSRPKKDPACYEFKRPRRANGGLLAAWNDGRVGIGKAVRLIVIEPMDRSVLYGERGRKVKSAKLMTGLWRITAYGDSVTGDEPKMWAKTI
jgi:hypothetical protein